jgi:hypothetical protein
MTLTRYDLLKVADKRTVNEAVTYMVCKTPTKAKERNLALLLKLKELL